MPDELARWRVQMTLEVNVIIHAADRQSVIEQIGDLDFTTFYAGQSGDLDFEITDHDFTLIDPEPLCKCGRLPECCDCDDD